MLGRASLAVALVFASYAAVAAPLSARRADGGWTVARPELLTSARRALVAVAIAVAAAAGLMWFALFTRDFSIEYVAMNTSRAAQPWYTLSALWAGMAGSLLLWCLVLAVFAAVFATRRGPELEALMPWAIPVLAGTLIFFLTITTLLENPFAAADVVALDGRGLNPLLHSPGMIIHPPLLYTGLIGLVVPFAIAMAALITKRVDGWITLARRWILVAWLSLGAGLVLGGAWAYTELGWGGYWGWDPVENAALMPWLVTTALVHSAMVQERRGLLKTWNVLLVTAAAVLATFGTFLTRSGLLSSVHTFAESPVGRWFFLFLAIQSIAGIGLLVWRLPLLRTRNQLDSAVSKEAAFLANNLLFCAAVMVVLWGTLLPLVTEAIGTSQLAVGPPFFNRFMAPVASAALALATVGTVVPWRRGTADLVVRRLIRPAIAAKVAALVALVAGRSLAFSVIVWLVTILVYTSVGEIKRAPRRAGGYLVHVGVAVMVLGMAGSMFRTQTEIVVPVGGSFRFAGYTFRFEGIERFEAPDKEVNLARLGLHRGGTRVTTLRPQLNFHRQWEQPQSEIAIRTTPIADLYVILAGTAPGESVFRVHHNPLVAWVWVGAAIALAGGLSALRWRTPRRPQTRSPEAVPARAPVPQP